MKVREGIQAGSKWENETKAEHGEASRSSESLWGDEVWPRGLLGIEMEAKVGQ